MSIRALIVDDEALARKRIRTLLREHPEIDIVAECSNGEEAIDAVEAHRPDLLFLDVQMPGLSGFDVLRTLGERAPLVIFVTAFDQYALEAFRVSAVQYLLKPVEREEFSSAVQRAERLLQEPKGESLNAISDLLKQIGKPPTFLQRIVVKSRGRTLFLKIDDVDWFESEGNYVRIHIKGEKHLLRETMGGIEEKLDPQLFVRIHRTAIVNLERIEELSPTSHGEYRVVLRGGARLTLSRVYRDRIEPLLGRL